MYLLETFDFGAGVLVLGESLMINKICSCLNLQQENSHRDAHAGKRIYIPADKHLHIHNSDKCRRTAKLCNLRIRPAQH